MTIPAAANALVAPYVSVTRDTLPMNCLDPARFEDHFCAMVAAWRDDTDAQYAALVFLAETHARLVHVMRDSADMDAVIDMVASIYREELAAACKRQGVA